MWNAHLGLPAKGSFYEQLPNSSLEQREMFACINCYQVVDKLKLCAYMYFTTLYASSIPGLYPHSTEQSRNNMLLSLPLIIPCPVWCFAAPSHTHVT